MGDGTGLRPGVRRRALHWPWVELEARDGWKLTLIGVVGLCGLALGELVPRCLEPVDDRPIALGVRDVENTNSGRWVRLRGRGSTDEGDVITVGGRPAGDGTFVFRLKEDPRVIVCTTRERRPDSAASVQTFTGLLVRLDDRRVEELSEGWACLSTHAPGDRTDADVYLLDGHEPRSRGLTLSMAFGAALVGLFAVLALHRLWRSGAARA